MSRAGGVMLLLWATFGAVVGCRSPSSPQPSDEGSAPEPAAGTPTRRSTATASGAPAAVSGARIEGTVSEAVDGGHYTYMKLETTDGAVWAAVPKARISPGQRVAVEQAMQLDRFHSPTLDRDFETIYFGVLEGARAAGPGRPPLPPKALPATIAIAKSRRLQAYRVAEVVRDAAELQGKTVRVRAMVVKASPGILGRN